MRAPALFLAAAAAVLAVLSAGSSPRRSQAARRVPELARRTAPVALPLFFEENRGQAPDAIRFVARAGKIRAGIAADGSLITMLSRREADAGASRRTITSRKISAGAEDREPACLRMRLAGGNPPRVIRGIDGLGTSVSYFRGADPAKWVTGVPAYRGVRCEAVYPGVDLICYGAGSRLEYDLVVAPGADPSLIRLRFSGQQALRLGAAGDLRLKTAGQELVHARPVIYQEGPRGRRPVEGEYVLLAANEVGFRLGGYDRTSPLVIDPVVTYLSYLGGSGDEAGLDGLSAARDAQGNLYVAGVTSSSDFPVADAYQETHRGGNSEGNDAFVAKLSPDGSQLLYATYLGGSASGSDSGDELNVSLAVDAGGSAIIAGGTTSPNFPLTPGAFRTTFGTPLDTFVARLSPEGNTLLSSTYIGGSNRDWPTDVALDGTGNAVVIGHTDSLDWVTTPGVLQTQNRGFFDAFLIKVAPNGTAITLSTLLGGTDYDDPLGVAVDAAQNLYVAGLTASADFPTANAVQPTHRGGFPAGFDAFVTKLNPTASACVYSTFLGGTLDDAVIDLEVDSSGQATVVGQTASADFPTSVSAYQTTHRGRDDAFVTRLASGGSVVYSTLLGASGDDAGYSLALDGQGRTYVAGRTDSPAFPAVRGVQATQAGGVDGFVAALNAGGTALTFSTYLGGGGDDIFMSLLHDADGQLTAVGYTTSVNLATTAAYQAASGGAADVFIARLAITGPEPPTNLQAVGSATPAVFLTWEDRSSDEIGFEIERATGPGPFGSLATVAPNLTNYQDDQVAANASYRYRVRALAADGPSAFSNTAQVAFQLPVPTPPTGLTVVTATADYVDLSWTDTSSTEAEFRIERDAGLGFQYIASAGADAPGFRDTSVLPNTNYRYRVIAANTAGASTPSNTATVATPDRVPAAPGNLRGRAVTVTRVELTWNDASSNETGFRIERSVGGNPGVEIGTVGANVSTYSDTTVALGATYTYRVRASNSAGNSSASNPLVVQVPSQAPTAPTSVTLEVVTSYRLRVSWTDRSSNETTFQLFRREGNGAFLLAEILPANTTSHLDTEVRPLTTYTYRIQASNAAGISAPATSSPLTMPGAGKLTVTPAKLSFAAVNVGRSVRKVVTLRNTGQGPLRITLQQAAAPFEVETPVGEILLAPRAKRQVGVRFSPGDTGTFISTLPVLSEANPVTVPLTGKGR